jgi:NDP-hexose-3-ketoreductase
MKILNVAVWGLGPHAIRRIIPALKKIEKISVYGVCSRSQKSVDMISGELNCQGWTSPLQMLKSKLVDIVYIATPIGLHAIQVKQALNAGKHVWCEKPLTCSLKEAKILISLASERNKMLTEGFMYLYHPQFEKVKSFVNENESNGIYSITARFGLPLLEKPGFRNDSSLCGGAFWDVASYTVSAVLALLPNQDVEVIFSEVITKDNEKVDSEGRALLRFHNGTRAFLEWGVGVAYQNEIDIWSHENSLYTDKIFSKPEDYQTVFSFRDKNGNQSFVNGKKSDQFVEMLSSYVDIYGSSKKINDEFQHILNRSKVMEKLINFTKLNQKTLQEPV